MGLIRVGDGHPEKVPRVGNNPWPLLRANRGWPRPTGYYPVDSHSLSANEEWFKIKKEEWIKNKEGGGGEVQGNTSTFLILINSSFADWAESPVATTVTPHSVADLQFPNFTI